MRLSSLLANGFLCTFPPQGGKIWVEIPAEEQDEDATQVIEEYKDPNQAPQPTKKSVSIQLPEINFASLFLGAGLLGQCPPTQGEKLKCILHYFERMSSRFSQEPSNERNVSFTRKVLTNAPKWESSTKTFGAVTIKEEGLIEDEKDHLQVDFANKMIGGGVLGKVRNCKNWI